MPFITQGKTNIKYILIVVVLAAIAGGGILGYYYLWIKDLETRLAVVELKMPEKISDETTGWKTYTNSALGFSLKYPPTVSQSFVAYSSGSGGNNILGINGSTQTEGTEFHDGLAIFIKSLAFKNSLQDTAINDRKSIEDNELVGVANNITIEFTTTIIDVGEATGVKQATNLERSDFIYLQLKNGEVLRFAGLYVGTKGNEYKSIFYNILSTFKFLD